jgi:protein-disulfide isomerase
LTEPSPKDNSEISAKESIFKSLLSKDNLTVYLAAGAFVFALAPYVLPNIQALIVRGGLTSQPLIVEDGLKALQAHKDKEAKAQFAIALKSNEQALIKPNDPILGNPKALITIVEFQDYFCGYCKVMAPQLEAFLKANPDVRVVVKEYPVVTKNSPQMAALALAASQMGQFERFHHAVYASDIQSNTDIDKVIVSVGLEPKALRQKATDAAILKQIRDTVDMGNSLGLSGTPAFIIDGVLVDGADMAQIKTLVATQRSKLASKRLASK